MRGEKGNREYTSMHYIRRYIIRLLLKIAYNIDRVYIYRSRIIGLASPWLNALFDARAYYHETYPRPTARSRSSSL